jgi:hypothetical protein
VRLEKPREKQIFAQRRQDAKKELKSLYDLFLLFLASFAALRETLCF